MKVVYPTMEGLMQAVAYLRKGEVVAYPTETVYGLAVDPTSEEALQRLFNVKGRAETNPVLMIISGVLQLQMLVGKIPETTERLISAFWPGPISMLFPRPDGLPKMLSADTNKICLRCPATSVARDLCRYFGGPLTSTSANISGHEPARSVDELHVPGVSLGIEGGEINVLPPSTIYDPDTDTILREGPITRSMIDKVLERI